MHAPAMRQFKNTRIAKMSSGHYCVIRDLGLVKGGKGLRHHEIVLDLTVRGVWRGVLRLATSAVRAQDAWHDAGTQKDASEPVLATQASPRSLR
jgi:hypothetical protein